MLYRNESDPLVERRLEWFLGPALVFLIAAIVCAVLMSRASGF